MPFSPHSFKGKGPWGYYSDYGDYSLPNLPNIHNIPMSMPMGGGSMPGVPEGFFDFRDDDYNHFPHHHHEGQMTNSKNSIEHDHDQNRQGQGLDQLPAFTHNHNLELKRESELLRKRRKYSKTLSDNSTLHKGKSRNRENPWDKYESGEFKDFKDFKELKKLPRNSGVAGVSGKKELKNEQFWEGDVSNSNDESDDEEDFQDFDDISSYEKFESKKLKRRKKNKKKGSRSGGNKTLSSSGGHNNLERNSIPGSSLEDVSLSLSYENGISDSSSAERDGRPRNRRSRRSVVHLYDMVVCATGCNPLAYKGYECYCGFLGSGLTVDGIDRCCAKHDWCYHHAKCPPLLTYFVPYYWTCNGGGHGRGGRGYPRCVTDYRGWKGICGANLCQCDLEFAQCLSRFPCPRHRAMCLTSPWRFWQNLFMTPSMRYPNY